MTDFPTPLKPLDKLRLLTKTHPEMFYRRKDATVIVVQAGPDLSRTDRSEVATLITTTFPRAKKFTSGVYGLGTASTHRLFENPGTRTSPLLTEQVRQQIVSEYHGIGRPKGAKTPSIRTLATDYGVSRATIHRLIRDTARLDATRQAYSRLYNQANG